MSNDESGVETKQCPNCNGHGRIGEFVETDRSAGQDSNYVGGGCDRCNGSGQL
jgi:DnaJ-class molecular chaperone